MSAPTADPAYIAISNILEEIRKERGIDSPPPSPVPIVSAIVLLQEPLPHLQPAVQPFSFSGRPSYYSSSASVRAEPEKAPVPLPPNFKNAETISEYVAQIQGTCQRQMNFSVWIGGLKMNYFSDIEPIPNDSNAFRCKIATWITRRRVNGLLRFPVGNEEQIIQQSIQSLILYFGNHKKGYVSSPYEYHRKDISPLLLHNEPKAVLRNYLKTYPSLLLSIILNSEDYYVLADQ